MITSIYSLAAGTSEHAAPAEYFEARVSVHVVAVPDSLNKLVAVVTRARIVSELSVVILMLPSHVSRPHQGG